MAQQWLSDEPGRQVVPSRTFGFNYAGISCQGATLHINPFLAQLLAGHIYESYYQEPVYDQLDLVGATDPEGNAIPDGQPDNPGNVLALSSGRRVKDELLN